MSKSRIDRSKLSEIISRVVFVCKLLKLAGFVNATAGAVTGVQAAGFVNANAGTAQGVQTAGFGNVSQGGQVLQVGGFFNVAQTATAQVAGFINVANQVKN